MGKRGCVAGTMRWVRGVCVCASVVQVGWDKQHEVPKGGGGPGSNGPREVTTGKPGAHMCMKDAAGERQGRAGAHAGKEVVVVCVPNESGTRLRPKLCGLEAPNDRGHEPTLTCPQRRTPTKQFPQQVFVASMLGKKQTRTGQGSPGGVIGDACWEQPHSPSHVGQLRGPSLPSRPGSTGPVAATTRHEHEE